MSCSARLVDVPGVARTLLCAAATLLSVTACQNSSPATESPSCAGAGSICTWAGNGDPAFTGDALPARQTALYWPVDVEFAPGTDGAGYILDWQNHRVRRVGADGLVETVIGTDEIGDGPGPGTPGSELGAPGIDGTMVNLNHPTDVVFTPDGSTLWLAAWHNHKVRQYDVSSGLLQVTCGRGPGFSGDKGPVEAALMNQPKALAFAASGDLFVLDTRNFRVRRIAANTGEVDTVVGIGKRGSAGDGGAPLGASFSFQRGLDQSVDDGGDNPEPGGAIALDQQGRLYIADTENHRVRRVDFALGTIETIAGTGTPGPAGDGGAAVAAELRYPRDLELGPDGRLYIADTDNHRIRAVDLLTGIIETVAGSGVPSYTGDGGGARAAALHRPWGIGFDGAGDLYIADTFNNRIRRVVKPAAGHGLVPQ